MCNVHSPVTNEILHSEIENIMAEGYGIPYLKASNDDVITGFLNVTPYFSHFRISLTELIPKMYHKLLQIGTGWTTIQGVSRCTHVFHPILQCGSTESSGLILREHLVYLGAARVMETGDLAKMPPVPPQKAEFPKFVDSLWCVYIVSVMAAFNAEFVTYPLDLIKTRLQIQGEQTNKNNNGKIGKAPYRGMLRTAIGITKEEGLSRLWQGVHAAFARHLVYSGTRIITYKALKEKVFKPNPQEKYFPVWQSALCGISAGAFAQYISSPADLLKVQLQMEGKRRLLGLPPRVHGIYDAFQKVWSSGGVRGLWKGSVPNVQRAALVNLGDLTTYDVAKRFIMRHTNMPDNHLLHMMASCCAGLVAASMGTPADVIKTRVMNQPLDEKGRGLLYTSSIDCLRKTVRLEGLGALYKGFVPIWMRMAPWSLTFWLTYEEIVKFMGAESW